VPRRRDPFGLDFGVPEEDDRQVEQGFGDRHGIPSWVRRRVGRLGGLRRELLPSLLRPRNPADAAPVRVALPADDVVPRERPRDDRWVLNLFAGVTIVAWVSIAGLRRHRWAPTALLAVSAAWSLTWIGVLLNVSGFVVRSPLVGYWLILVSIGVVVTGAIVVWISSRENMSASPPPGDAVAATRPHVQ
jgi:hypothetical protein